MKSLHVTVLIRCVNKKLAFNWFSSRTIPQSLYLGLLFCVIIVKLHAMSKIKVSWKECCTRNPSRLCHSYYHQKNKNRRVWYRLVHIKYRKVDHFLPGVRDIARIGEFLEGRFLSLIFQNDYWRMQKWQHTFPRISKQFKVY